MSKAKKAAKGKATSSKVRVPIPKAVREQYAFNKHRLDEATKRQKDLAADDA